MLSKAKKKPVIIEFIKLTEKNIVEVYTEVFGKPYFSCQMAEDSWDTYQDIVKRDGMKLKTPESGEGTQIASIGDYVVFGESKKLGRHCWPVKPDYFKGAYDIIN